MHRLLPRIQAQVSHT